MHAHARTMAVAAALGVLGIGGLSRGDEADALFRSAAEHYAAQQWQAACDDFSQLLATAPEHQRANQARFHFGEALVQLQRYDKARQQFDDLLQRDPKHRYAKHAMFRSGEAAYLAGDRDAARRQLQAFREQHADDALNATALAHLGRIELDDGKPAAAEPLFATAVDRYAESPLADQCRLGLAEAREALQRHDEARRGYRQLVDAKSPLADHALLRLAALDNDQGDHAASLAGLEQLEKEMPGSTLIDRARLGRGYALYKLGRHADAETVLAELTDRAGLAIDAHYWLGMSQVAHQSWKQGAKTFAAGAAIDGKHRLNEPLTYHAARALLQDGQVQAATDAFDRLLREWPDSALADESWLGKVQAAATRDEHSNCVRLADAFASKFPTSPLFAEVEASKGRALAALGKHAQAAAALERSLAASAGDGEKAKTGEGEPAKQPAGRRAELATSYAQLGRFADAAKIVKTLYEPETSTATADETCYRVAERAYAGDDLKTADTLFSLLVQHGKSDDARRGGLLGQGWCRYQRGDWKGAAEALEQLLAQFPDSAPAVEATVLRGRALEKLGEPAGALAMYRQVVDQHDVNPRTAEALYRAAGLHDQLDQKQEAIQCYARLVDQHADFGELDAAIYRWGWLARATDPAAADDLFARLRRDFPDSQYVPDATLQLAERAFAREDYDQAQALLDEITDAEAPAAARQNGLYLLGRVAAAGENWALVESSLAQLVGEAPGGELALAAAYLRAEASYRRGLFAESAQRFAALNAEAASRRQPWSAAAELRRAQALVQLKQWPEALSVARGVLADFPDFERRHEADYVVGRCMAAEADFAAAREAYARVIDSPRAANTETAAMAQWMIGESYFHQENHAAALAEYEKVDQQYPFARWRATARLQSGKCHEQLGQWALAIEKYESMLKDFPDHDLSAEAARRAAAARLRIAGRGSPPK